MIKKAAPPSIVKHAARKMPSQVDFDQVRTLIDAPRTRAIAAVNTPLMDPKQWCRRPRRPSLA